MKSFLVRGKKPVCKWGLLPDGIYYKGAVPEGYSLAVCPSPGIIIIDVDRHGNMDGFDNIPESLKAELGGTLNYHTKNNGKHYWFKYTGSKELANKTSNKGIDLRTHKGYAVWYPKAGIQDSTYLIRESSADLNSWVESLFSYK